MVRRFAWLSLFFAVGASAAELRLGPSAADLHLAATQKLSVSVSAAQPTDTVVTVTADSGGELTFQPDQSTGWTASLKVTIKAGNLFGASVYVRSLRTGPLRVDASANGLTSGRS